MPDIVLTPMTSSHYENVEAAPPIPKQDQETQKFDDNKLRNLLLNLYLIHCLILAMPCVIASVSAVVKDWPKNVFSLDSLNIIVTILFVMIIVPQLWIQRKRIRCYNRSVTVTNFDDIAIIKRLVKETGNFVHVEVAERGKAFAKIIFRSRGSVKKFMEKIVKIEGVIAEEGENDFEISNTISTGKFVALLAQIRNAEMLINSEQMLKSVPLSMWINVYCLVVSVLSIPGSMETYGKSNLLIFFYCAFICFSVVGILFGIKVWYQLVKDSKLDGKKIIVEGFEDADAALCAVDIARVTSVEFLYKSKLTLVTLPNRVATAVMKDNFENEGLNVYHVDAISI
ncbi:hypothetical protein CAEBREN_22237 [Caenorhabditis brenneri]|uniref:Uncharacterized protein n=1 Tax=Caenorhabditis brenneri TaxID=135651 RepID=G0MC39_CAEBE|nr:hypothetical protein CAEBREN_22237 [Caenorhabditis brenneri]